MAGTRHVLRRFENARIITMMNRLHDERNRATKNIINRYIRRIIYAQSYRCDKHTVG